MIINCNEIINNKQQLYTMYTVYTRQTNISVNKHQQQTKHQPIPPTQETHSADTPPINDTSSNRNYLSLNTWPNSFQPLTQAKHCRWSLWRNIVWKLTIHVAWSKLCQYNLWSTNMMVSVHCNSLKTSLSSWARQSINSTCI